MTSWVAEPAGCGGGVVCAAAGWRAAEAASTARKPRAERVGRKFIGTVERWEVERWRGGDWHRQDAEGAKEDL